MFVGVAAGKTLDGNSGSLTSAKVRIHPVPSIAFTLTHVFGAFSG